MYMSSSVSEWMWWGIDGAVRIPRDGGDGDQTLKQDLASVAAHSRVGADGRKKQGDKEEEQEDMLTVGHGTRRRR